MTHGFIKLHRKILENPVAKKPKYFSIFVYLILNANHKDNDIILNNKKITIKRGSFVGSIQGISKHFKNKISRTSVGNILKYLISDTMLDIKTTNKYTIFTILNYDEYQKMDTSLDNKRTTNGQQTDNKRTQTIKKRTDKKEKKLKEKNIKKEKFGEFEKVLLSKQEYEKLIQIYKGNHDLLKAIEILDSYLASSGKTYKSHYAIMGKTKWVYQKVYKKSGGDENKSQRRRNAEMMAKELGMVKEVKDVRQNAID